MFVAWYEASSIQTCQDNVYYLYNMAEADYGEPQQKGTSA